MNFGIEDLLVRYGVSWEEEKATLHASWRGGTGYLHVFPKVLTATSAGDWLPNNPGVFANPVYAKAHTGARVIPAELPMSAVQGLGYMSRPLRDDRKYKRIGFYKDRVWGTDGHVLHQSFVGPDHRFVIPSDANLELIGTRSTRLPVELFLRLTPSHHLHIFSIRDLKGDFWVAFAADHKRGVAPWGSMVLVAKTVRDALPVPDMQERVRKDKNYVWGDFKSEAMVSTLCRLYRGDPPTTVLFDSLPILWKKRKTPDCAVSVNFRYLLRAVISLPDKLSIGVSAPSEPVLIKDRLAETVRAYIMPVKAESGEESGENA